MRGLLRRSLIELAFVGHLLDEVEAHHATESLEESLRPFVIGVDGEARIQDAVDGVVLGDFGDGATPEDEPTLPLDTVFADYFEGRPYPVVRGLRYGHLLPRCSLPIGAPVRLSATPESAGLTLRASVVEP